MDQERHRHKRIGTRMQKECDMEHRAMNDDMAARITALIDGALGDEERAQAMHELGSSQQLQRQHDVETALVATLRDRRDRLRTSLPPAVERRVRMAVNAEALPRLTFAERYPALTFWRAQRVAWAAAAIVVVAVLLLQPSAIKQLTGTGAVAAAIPVDVPTQSYANYASIVQGSMQVGKSSTDQRELKSYFASQGVTYDVQFPAIDATLKGGVVSDHGGRKFAHLVYERAGHTIYMFEVDQESIDANHADLGQVVSDDIMHSRWHWEERADTGTLFAWKSNNVVCVAVSDLRTDELSALFDLQEL